MSPSRRSVLIPLASGSGKYGRIAHVHADGNRPSNDAKLIPEIALLNDCKLYQAGAIALAAVRQVAPKPSRLAVTGWLKPPAPAYLSVSNAPDLYGMALENSESAQLGLALALVMYQCQGTVRLAMATGKLETKAPLGRVRGRSLEDVPVCPVGLMEAKLDCVGRLLDDYKGGAFSETITFFFPRYTVEGGETLAQYREKFEGIVACYSSRGIELRLCPVSRLQDALQVLELNSLPATLTDRLTLIAAAFGLVTGTAGAAAHWWLAQPITLEFARYQLDTGEKVQTPFPVRLRHGDSFEEVQGCVNAAGIHFYPVDLGIAFRAVVTDRDSWTEAVAGYHFAVVTVSAQSGVKVLPPDVLLPSGREVSVVVPTSDVAESNALFVLAKRFAPFDTEALRARLAVLQVPPGERINAALNVLSKAAPGYLSHMFESVKGDLPCQP